MNKGIKYCLHPGKLKVKVAGRKENGEASDKADWAMRYFSAKDLANSYGVKLEECVIWGRGIKSDDFIHLKPDPKGRYVIEELQGDTSPSKNESESPPSLRNLVRTKKKASSRK